MAASGHIGFVFSILVVVDDYLFSNLRNDFGMEEDDVLGWSLVHCDCGLVHFVYPEVWSCPFHVFESILNIGTDCVVSKGNFKWIGKVD